MHDRRVQVGQLVDEPHRETRDDQREVDEREPARDALGLDAIVGIDRVRVNVRYSDVTLTGTVRSPEHRSAALAAAANAPGVADVHDAITVRAAGAARDGD